MSSSVYNMLEQCLSNICSEGFVFTIGGVMSEMYYKFSPLASPSPYQGTTNDAFAAQNSRL